MLSDSSSVEAFLQPLELFDGVSAEDVHRIAVGSVMLDAKRGTGVLRRGEAALGLYVVLSGRLKTSLLCPHRPEKVMAILVAGDFFGEANLFRCHTSLLDVESLDDSLVLAIARETMLGALESCPHLARNLAGCLSKRVLDLTREIEAQALCSGTERVIAYLLRALPAERTSGPQRLLLEVKKGLIASQLNLTQEHFSRVLRELSDADLVRVQGNEVVIPDVEKLRPSSCGCSRAARAEPLPWSARASH